jgi:hypothetical protein
MRDAAPAGNALLKVDNPAVREASERLLKVLATFGTDLVEGSRELSLHLRLDRGKEEIAAEAHFKARENSPLSRKLATMEDTASLFAVPSAGKPGLHAHIRFRLPEELRRILETMSHAALEQSLREEKDRDKHKADENFVRSLEPTIAAGVLDAALFLHSQGEGKLPLSVGALKVVKGKEMEKAFRELVGTLPDAERGLFRLDVAKAAGANIHALSMKGKFPPGALAVFGPDPSFYYAFRDDAVLFAVGEQAPELMRQVLEGRPRRDPPVLLELNVKNLLELIPVPDKEKNAARTAVTDAHPGRVRLSLGGGAILRLSLDLSLLRLAANMGVLQMAPKIELKQH